MKLSVFPSVVGALLCGCSGDFAHTARQELSERQRLTAEHTWASNRPENSGFDCDEYLARQKGP
jgi:hypothetical protein